MERCLQLAKMGAGFVAPNPMVGAVLVCDDLVIGEGYHQKFGEAHAEVICINSVADANRHLISKSTLYVSLEPCAHFGKTPPCADLIIEKKVPRVVIACRDTFREVDGKGIDKLIAAGIRVVTGVCETAAREVNKRFFTFHEKQRPFIILKWAQSNNNNIANADFSSVRISNDCTNRLVHKWRAEEAAIMVGTNTAFYDNPALTNRYWTGNNPVRVVIDKNLSLPRENRLFNHDGITIVFNNQKESDDSTILFRILSEGKNVLEQVMAVLFSMNISSVLVEGGAKLIQSFIEEKLWDEARVITNTDLVIENGLAAPVLKHYKNASNEVILSDTIQYYLRHEHF